MGNKHLLVAVFDNWNYLLHERFEATIKRNIYHNSYEFSFSGIKSHVINLVHNIKQRNEELNIPDLCASFQETVSDVLVNKSIKAIKEYNAKMFMIAGGVAANKGLRKKIDERITDVKVVVPEFRYCTDNAAMIGIAGYYQYMSNKKTDDMKLNGKSRLHLE